LFFVFAYSVCDGFDGGAQGGDLVGEPGQGAAGGGLVAVLVDDRAQGGVAVEGGEVPRASRTGDPLGSFSEKVRARASESTEVLPGVQR
jgi:hypothetical protein